MSSSTAHARGMAFLGVLGELRRLAGVQRVTTKLPTWGDAIANVTSQRVERNEWYPYSAFAQLLAGADRDLGDGDGVLCKRLGFAAAKRDLGGAFAVLKLLASPQHLIGSCERVWPRYYRDAGRMEAVSTLPTRTVLRIHAFPDMASHHCRMMEGWMISAMEELGANVLPGACEIACMASGAPHHEFVCTWQKR